VPSPTTRWGATEQSFSPDPANPPYYIDLPYRDAAATPFKASKSPPERVDAVWEKWLAHAPLAITRDYGMNLLLYRGVAFDIGSNDDKALVEGACALSDALAHAGVAHVFEEYQGDRTNRVAERFTTHVLPFVSANLEGD